MTPETNKTRPLDDLSLDDVPMLMDIDAKPVVSTTTTAKISENVSTPLNTCKDETNVYKIGEKFNRGCNETCTCTSNGEIECEKRCKRPLERRGFARNDKFCREMPTEDECCVMIQCTQEDTGNFWETPFPPPLLVKYGRKENFFFYRN